MVLADIGDANPLFQLGVYAYGAGENLSQSVNADTGPSVWWYPTQGVCATNGYPTKDQFNSKKLPYSFCSALCRWRRERRNPQTRLKVRRCFHLPTSGMRRSWLR